MAKKKVSTSELDQPDNVVSAADQPNDTRPDTPPAPAARTAKGPITVKFRDHAGNPTERTFSEDVHGPEYAKLAESFRVKHAARLIA